MAFSLGIPWPLWSRRALRDLIRKESGISLPVQRVGKYLKRWGYTAKRPRRHSKDQDPEEVRTWLAEAYPLIEEQAEQEGAEIVWGDEAGVAADEYPRVGYARQGRPASMEVPDRRIRINMISAISNAGTLRFVTYKGGDERGAVHRLPGAVAAQHDAEGLADRVSSPGPRGSQDGGVAGEAQGAHRGVLLATLCR
jgi:hypothetical protein